MSNSPIASNVTPNADPSVSSPPRLRRRRANRQRILEAAAQVIATDGVRELSVRRVADVADYTPGALYRYFASRDVILAAVTEQVIDRLTERLATAESRSTSALGALTALVDAYRNFSVEDPHGFGLVTEMVAHRETLIDDDAVTADLIAAVLRALAPVRRAFAAAVVSGELHEGPSDGRALALFSAVHGALLLSKLSRRAQGLFDADVVAAESARALLVGWGAQPSALNLRASSARSDQRGS